MIGHKHINYSVIGDIGEYFATLSLQLRGAEVFKNTVRTGVSDLAMLYKDVTYYIDVKVARRISDCIAHSKSDVWSATRAYQVKSPVIPLIVYPITGADMSGWYCDWHMTKKGYLNLPTELEDFWK